MDISDPCACWAGSMPGSSPWNRGRLYILEQCPPTTGLNCNHVTVNLGVNYGHRSGSLSRPSKEERDLCSLSAKWTLPWWGAVITRAIDGEDCDFVLVRQWAIRSFTHYAIRWRSRLTTFPVSELIVWSFGNFGTTSAPKWQGYNLEPHNPEMSNRRAKQVPCTAPSLLACGDKQFK